MRSIYLFILLFITLNTFSQKEEFTAIVQNPSSPVKLQSGNTCWIYATCSFIESELLRLKKGTYELSEDFFVYYEYIDKAQNYVLRLGNTSFGQGGVANDVLRMVKERGIIPAAYYRNDPVRNNSELKDVLLSYLKTILKDDNPSENWKKHYRALLDSYFDTIPKRFEFEGQNYTPLSFVKHLGINIDDYISITSFTHHPFNTYFTLETSDNFASNVYYNLKLDELAQIVDTALVHGYTLLWGGDFSEPGFSDKKKGLAILPQKWIDESDLKSDITEINVDQQMRQLAYENLRTTDDHLMHIIGIAKGKTVKFFIYSKILVLELKGLIKDIFI